MKTRSFLGPLCISLAIFALPAAAQTPDGLTPAVEGPSMCDPLASATPGLQGLCVAMCEAQDCEATMDDQGNVSFSPSCKSSARQILANYDKLATPVDPPMPCVKVACPCWASDEIENIADQNDVCVGGREWAMLYGSDKHGGTEYTYTAEDAHQGAACSSVELNPNNSSASKAPISSAAYATCRKAVVTECRRRNLDTSWAGDQ